MLHTSALKAEPKAVSLRGLSSFRVTGQKSSYRPCLRPSGASGGPVPVPDLVFLPDYRAEVKLSAASEGIWDARRDGSGAGFGLPFRLPGRSRDFTPTTPDFGQEVKIYFFKF